MGHFNVVRVKLHSKPYTVKCRYNAVKYIMILHTTMQWQQQNRNQNQISNSWASYMYGASDSLSGVSEPGWRPPERKTNTAFPVVGFTARSLHNTISDIFLGEMWFNYPVVLCFVFLSGCFDKGSWDIDIFLCRDGALYVFGVLKKDI